LGLRAERGYYTMNNNPESPDDELSFSDDEAEPMDETGKKQLAPQNKDAAMIFNVQRYKHRRFKLYAFAWSSDPIDCSRIDFG